MTGRELYEMLVEDFFDSSSCFSWAVLGDKSHKAYDRTAAKLALIKEAEDQPKRPSCPFCDGKGFIALRKPVRAISLSELEQLYADAVIRADGKPSAEVNALHEDLMNLRAEHQRLEKVQEAK
jgi:hypothetical protein